MAYKAGSVFVDAELRDQKFRAGMASLGGAVKKGALAIGVAFVAGMVVSIKKADEFQKAMSNVATVIDTSVISTQDLTMSLLKMDPALGSVTELTNGMYQAFSAGAGDAEEALEITANSAMFAKAALTDTATAVDVLTTAQNAYGRDVVNTTQAADIFFTTIKQGKITGEQLAGTIGQSIPLYASMGIEMEQLASGIAAMTKQGISASESTTQLNAIVNAFIKPSQEMTEAVQAMGYSTGAAFIEAEGLSGALEFLEDATGGSADEISKLVPNIRGLKGVMALTGQGGKIFNDVMEEMEDAVGANAEAFNKQEKTFETFKNTMDRTMVIVGNIGKSFVDEIAGGATDAFDAMNDFLMTGEAAEIFGQVIGTIGAAFAGLKAFMAPIVDTIGVALSDIMATISEVIMDLTGETDSASGAFNVLGLVSTSLSFGISMVSQVVQSSIEIFGSWVTAITETGKSIGLLFRLMTKDVTWEDMKNQLATTGDAFRTLGGNYVDSFIDLYETGSENIKNFGADSEEVTTEIHSNVESTYRQIENTFTSTWNRLISGQKDHNDDRNEEQEDSDSDLTAGNEETTTELVRSWSTAWAEIKAGNTTMYDDMMTNASEALSTVENIYNDSFGAIFEAQDMFLQNQADNQEQAYATQLEALNAELEAETITEEEYDQRKLDIEEAHGKEMNAIQKKQFEANKKSRIAQVWIDAASSIMGWWAAAPQLGIIAGPIVAAIMTGVTLGAAGAQSVAIGQQNFVPAFAAGGTMRGSGFAQVNENGGEIQRLGDGTTIIPNDISRDIASNAGNTFNVSFAGANISDNMSLNKIVDQVSRRLGKEMRAAS